MAFNYYPSSYRSLGASLSTSASRSIAGPIVLSLDRNKPVTEWLQVEPEGATGAPSGAGVTIVDDGDITIETELAHRSRQDS